MDVLSRLASSSKAISSSSSTTDDETAKKLLRAATLQERARLQAGTSRVGWHVHGTHVFAIPTGVVAAAPPEDEKKDISYPSVYYPQNNSDSNLKANMDSFLKFIDEARTLLARWDHSLQEYRALHMQDRTGGYCCGGCCIQGDWGCRCSCARCCHGSEKNMMPVAELARRSVPQDSGVNYYFVHKKKGSDDSYYWAWVLCVLVTVFLFVAMVWAWGGTPRVGAIWEDDHAHDHVVLPVLNSDQNQQRHSSGPMNTQFM